MSHITTHEAFGGITRGYVTNIPQVQRTEVLAIKEEAPQGDTVVSSAPATYAQKRFYSSDPCEQARKLLEALVNSPDYNTNPSPLMSNPIPFVERHLNHLSMYPKIDLGGYISNLKLRTSIKRSRPAR